MKAQCLKCSHSFKLSRPDDRGLKHGHCKFCKLEWHITQFGEIYSHNYKPRKTLVNPKIAEEQYKIIDRDLARLGIK